MSERTEITELVDAIFDTVDAKDWEAVRALFDDEVTVDFTSLDGGGPAVISSTQLAEAWRQGLHARKKSFHMVGHYRIAVTGDTATAAIKGYAYNVLDDELGGGMWEGWGLLPDPAPPHPGRLEGDRAGLLRLAHPRRRIGPHSPALLVTDPARKSRVWMFAQQIGAGLPPRAQALAGERPRWEALTTSD